MKQIRASGEQEVGKKSTQTHESLIKTGAGTGGSESRL